VWKVCLNNWIQAQKAHEAWQLLLVQKRRSDKLMLAGRKQSDELLPVRRKRRQR